MATVFLERGDTFDLNRFVTGADTISFQSGQTIPFGLTMTDGIIQVPEDATTVDTPSTVYVTGTNRIGATNHNFQAQIVNSAIDIRDRSFQKVPPAWTVMIGGINISQHLISVDNISYNLDLYDTGEFLASECTIQLTNKLRLYQRGGQFYTDNSINPFTTEVVVIGQIGNVSRRMFTGKILGISEQIDPNQDDRIELECVDDTRDLRDNLVVNFGVRKYHVPLTPEGAGPIGNYSIPEGLTPISDESLTLTTEGRQMNVVTDEALRIFGKLEYLNAKQSDIGVNTEGGLLETVPIASVKSPYTYAETEVLLELFLAHEGIVNRKIERPGLLPGRAPWYGSVGRVGFNEEHTSILRYGKDSVYDSTNKDLYILAGSPYTTAQDFLWRWDLEEDQWELVTSFDAKLEMWQMDSSNYEDFYIMGTEARSDISYIPNGTYDASEAESGSPSLVKIYRFDKSANSTTEFITGSNSYPPTLAHRYAVGFPRENANSYRFGNVPDTRGGFKIVGSRLFYRYATTNTYGVAECRISTGATSATVVVNPPASDFAQRTDCVFYVSGNWLYVAYVNNQGTLFVQRRATSGGSLNAIWTSLVGEGSRVPNQFTNRWTDLAPMEIFVHGSTVYFTMQFRYNKETVEQQFPEADADEYAFAANASAVLCSVPVSGGDVTILKYYDYCQTAARSFVVHNNETFFFEGSPLVYKYPPYRPAGLPVDDTDWKSLVGLLKKIDGDDIEDVGLVWRSVLDNPRDPDDLYYGIHGATVSPMHSIDGQLYMISGYGDFDLIGQPGAEINHVYNDSIIQYGTDTKFRLPQVLSNQRTGYLTLQEIANSTNSIFGVDQQRFFWKTRQNIEAQLSGALNATDSSLSYDSAITPFADSGFLQIDNEVMSYTGKTDTAITGLTRGFAGTTAASHTDNTFILHIDHVIFGNVPSTPIRNLQIRDDYTNLHNSIFIKYANGTQTYHTEDAESIALYGEHEHEIDTILHFTQGDWAKSLGNNYLRSFKNLEQIVNFNSDLALFLSVGDVIYLESRTLSAAMRIYNLEHDFNSKETSVSARTITY